MLSRDSFLICPPFFQELSLARDGALDGLTWRHRATHEPAPPLPHYRWPKKPTPRAPPPYGTMGECSLPAVRSGRRPCKAFTADQGERLLSWKDMPADTVYPLPPRKVGPLALEREPIIPSMLPRTTTQPEYLLVFVRILSVTLVGAIMPDISLFQPAAFRYCCSSQLPPSYEADAHMDVMLDDKRSAQLHAPMQKQRRHIPGHAGEIVEAISPVDDHERRDLRAREMHEFTVPKKPAPPPQETDGGTRYQRPSHALVVKCPG